MEHIQKLHPEAPAPGVYLSAPLFENARSTRESMGDEAFFSKLNSTRSDDGDGWGDLEADWDAGSFEETVQAPAGSELRSRLVGDLVDTHFPAYKKIAANTSESFVSLDEGLAVMSQHAKSLGYDAVVLFLDELILWLASRMQDRKFVTEEGQKISKLVESSRADRPVPLISFVARQRDLNDFIGEHISGSEKQSFTDVLRWWEGRFDKITLEDRNLPVILKEILFGQLDLEDPDALHHRHNFIWRGTQREVEILFGNIRDRNLPEESFKAQGKQWKVITLSRELLEQQFDLGGRPS